tara:strand:- start:667 stop:1230 length:564 start_codon:yes stop_codon:yes gene_type:complete
MIKNQSIIYFERVANFLEVTGVMLVLLMAFIMQFAFNELPCPLCLLQRFGFMAIAFGFLLNFRFGFRPSHYAIILLSSLFTSFVALRQIALHVLPGTGHYGSAVFGLHLYTWSYIVSMLIIISTSALLGIDRQYLEKARKNVYWQYVIQALFIFLVFLTVSNIVSAVLECGFTACPENPAGYVLLSK